MDDRTAERVARNDATFRAANEQISSRAEESGITEDVPFLCECADEACTEIVRLSSAEYERIRREPTWFLNARGHNAAGGAWVEVLERHRGYEVVGKVGHAGEVAQELDPRAGR